MKKLAEQINNHIRINGINKANLIKHPVLILKLLLFVFTVYSISARDTNAQSPFLSITLNQQNANLSSIKETSLEYAPGETTINWMVEKESAVTVYVIEKSMDMLNFKQIGKVVSGPTNNLAAYFFSDKNPASGHSYYRILVARKDGSYGYTNPVMAINEFDVDKTNLAVLDKK